MPSVEARIRLYSSQAADLRALAKRAKTEEAKAEYLRLAIEYDKLAATLEDKSRRR